MRRHFRILTGEQRPSRDQRARLTAAEPARARAEIVEGWAGAGIRQTAARRGLEEAAAVLTQIVWTAAFA